MKKYKFDPEACFACIKAQWLQYAETTHAKKFIIGNSGGKDSAVCIYLAAKIFGKGNVIALSMPNGTQPDIDDAKKVARLSGVKPMTCNIGESFSSLANELKNFSSAEVDPEAIINLAPRLRMTALYLFGRQYGAFVVNTDNLDERIAGYFTLYGDGAGDYAPLRDLTVTEVIALGEWLKVPDEIIHKKPGDGLQAKGDEARLGFKYAELDKFIRLDKGSEAFKDKILERFSKNVYKTNMVNIPGPEMPYPNYVWYRSYLENCVMV